MLYPSSLRWFTLTALLLLHGCGDPDSQNPADRLKELQAEQAKIQSEIAEIQAQLSKKPGAAGPAANAKLVEVMALKPGTFETWVEVQGHVDARQSVEVTAESMGVVRQIRVREGQKVTKGQVLAELDQSLLLQSLEELQGQLDFATQLYSKQANLWKQNIGSEIQYLNAKNQKESLERRKATLQTQLDMTRIKAPVSGTVDQVYLKLGQSAALGMPAVRVVNFDDLRVVADLSETYVNRVKEGAAAQMLFKDLELSANGKVSYVARSISPLNRTFRVEIPLNNRSGLYRPNMIVGIKIMDYTNPTALKIPVNLIQRSDEGTYVMVARPNGAAWSAGRAAVELGRSNGVETEITGGLKSGDRVITTGYNDLNEGQTLRIP